MDNESDINLNIKTPLEEENSFEVMHLMIGSLRSGLYIYCNFGMSIQV